MSYTEAVIRCGGIPVILPYSTHKEELLEALALCDGVIIPGGVDVDASYFDEVPHPACGEVDPILDDIEFSALKYLEEHRVPALGICRGAQVMNIYAGGTIYQDLASQYPAAHQHRQKQDRIYPSHEVTIEKEGSSVVCVGRKN